MPSAGREALLGPCALPCPVYIPGARPRTAPPGGRCRQGRSCKSLDLTSHDLHTLTVPSVNQPLRVPVPGVKARREVPAPPNVPPGLKVPPTVLLLTGHLTLHLM